MQLALNKSIDKSHIIVLAEAVAGQITPSSGDFYRHAEPERIARTIAFSMLRDDVELEFWQTWLEKVAAPRPFETWREVFMSDKGLAKRNNRR